jgi:hypothetical protein
MPRNIISLQFDLNVSFHNPAKQDKSRNQIIFRHSFQYPLEGWKNAENNFLGTKYL